MANGMEMMLKSMGIDTEAIKMLLDPNNVKQLLHKVQTLCESVEEIKVSVQRIEIKLGTLPESVATKLLEDGASDAFKAAAEFVREYNDGNSGDSDNGNGDGSHTGPVNGNDANTGNG